jgi:hypothetical protein
MSSTALNIRQEMKCMICCTYFNDGEMVRTLPCTHKVCVIVMTRTDLAEYVHVGGCSCIKTGMNERTNEWMDEWVRQ